MRISDWSSDVCSSDLVETVAPERRHELGQRNADVDLEAGRRLLERRLAIVVDEVERIEVAAIDAAADRDIMVAQIGFRSEEHTSELQSLMRISYAVFCLKKKRYKTLH